MQEEKIKSKFTDDEFIHILASKLRCNPLEARKVANSFVETVVKCIVENESLHIRKFGLFYLKRKKDAKARHPISKEKMTVPGYWMVRFNPALSLKQKTDYQKKLREANVGF